MQLPLCLLIWGFPPSFFNISFSDLEAAGLMKSHEVGGAEGQWTGGGGSPRTLGITALVNGVTRSKDTIVTGAVEQLNVGWPDVPC